MHFHRRKQEVLKYVDVDDFPAIEAGIVEDDVVAHLCSTNEIVSEHKDGRSTTQASYWIIRCRNATPGFLPLWTDKVEDTSGTAKPLKVHATATGRTNVRVPWNRV